MKINATHAFRFSKVCGACAGWPIETLKGEIPTLRLRAAFISCADLCPDINIEYKAPEQKKVACVIRAWPTTVWGPRCSWASTSTNPCGTFEVHDLLEPTKFRQPRIVGILSEFTTVRGPPTLKYPQMLASGAQDASGYKILGLLWVREHPGSCPKACEAHGASTSTNPCGTFGVHDRLGPTTLM